MITKNIKNENNNITLDNNSTQTINVSNKKVRKTKKESKRKRKKDQFYNLKNENGYIIEVKNLTKNYISSGNSLTKVLIDLNLKIKSGEFVVLFGKSGSGKSTLLNIISGLDRATSGQVIVFNKNLPYLSNNELTMFRREHLAFIFQQYHLLNNITGYENVETGQYLQKSRKKSIDIKELFKEFELIDVMEKYPSQMSGGQQQRISIMRALAKDANIIFADEPTGALDKKTSTIVLNMLKKINQEQGKTIIMVSHDPEVTKYATRVIVLEKGKIIKDSQEQLLSISLQQENQVTIDTNKKTTINSSNKYLI